MFIKISIFCPGPVDTKFKENANVDFVFNGIKSYDVAQYALNNLDRFYIVPKGVFKVTRFMAYILPSRMIAKVVYTLQSKKEM